MRFDYKNNKNNIKNIIILVTIFFSFSFFKTFAGIVGTYPTAGLYGSYVLDKGNDINIVGFFKDFNLNDQFFRVFSNNGTIIGNYTTMPGFDYNNSTINKMYVFTNNQNNKTLFISFTRYISGTTQNRIDYFIYNKTLNTYQVLGTTNTSDSNCNKNIDTLKGAMLGNILQTSCGTFDFTTNAFTIGAITDTEFLNLDTAIVYNTGLDYVEYINPTNKSLDYLVYSTDSLTYLSLSSSLILNNNFSTLSFGKVIDTGSGTIISLKTDQGLLSYNPYEPTAENFVNSSVYYTNINNNNIYKIINQVNPLNNQSYYFNDKQVLFFGYINTGVNYLWYVGDNNNIYNDNITNLVFNNYISNYNDPIFIDTPETPIGGTTGNVDSIFDIDRNGDGDISIIEGTLALFTIGQNVIKELGGFIDLLKQLIQPLFNIGNNPISTGFSFIPKTQADFSISSTLENIDASDSGLMKFTNSLKWLLYFIVFLMIISLLFG